MQQQQGFPSTVIADDGTGTHAQGAADADGEVDLTTAGGDEALNDDQEEGGDEGLNDDDGNDDGERHNEGGDEDDDGDEDGRNSATGRIDPQRLAQPLKLFVGQVPKTLTEDDLAFVFEPYGRILDLTVIRDRRTG